MAAYNDIVTNPGECPLWLTQGVTYLLPKSKETQNPKNYRPITCLPTMYKLLTSILAERMYHFLDDKRLLPPEQKGCRKGSYGCKDQLLINKAILEEVKLRRRSLSTAWIDYKKAYDSVPHSWILETLNIHRVCPTITHFIKKSMKTWQTTLKLHSAEGLLSSRTINIRAGIFQGDSLSPLLFCLALASLSHLLKESSYGYTSQYGRINHLLYMDDLKTYAKNDEQQLGLITIVKTFSDDICMEFGLDKCAKATFKRGKLFTTQDLEIDMDTKIKELEQEQTYKYLGIDEGDGIQHSKYKERIRKEYYSRIRMIFKSELSSANKIKAINTLAVPVVTYSFNVIKWSLTDIKSLDIKTRKIMTMERLHHPKADVDRLYIPRASGGRGLIQLELTYKTTTTGLEVYLRKTEDLLISIVRHHETSKKTHSQVQEAKEYREELAAPELTPNENEGPTTYAKRVKKAAKTLGQRQLHETWTNKPLHGVYCNRMDDPDVDTCQTNQWLRSAGLKAETEGLIVAAQDQSLATRAYLHRIVNLRWHKPSLQTMWTIRRNY